MKNKMTSLAHLRRVAAETKHLIAEVAGAAADALDELQGQLDSGSWMPSEPDQISVSDSSGAGVDIFPGSISVKDYNGKIARLFNHDGALSVQSGPTTPGRIIGVSSHPVVEDEVASKGYVDQAVAQQIVSITIAAPPNKVMYKVGDTFDPAGMSVLANLSNGMSMQISANHLAYTPAGVLAETVSKITVSFAVGTKTFTVQQPITVTSANIYGVRWDGTAIPVLTRTDDAASFTRPIPYTAGATKYGSPFDTLMPWAGMVKSERAGGTMVAIPKFWYKITKIGDGIEIQIADKAVPGFFVSPAHVNRGDGKGERNVVYIGRYLCASDYKSRTGEKPKVSFTRAAGRSSIHALGTNIWQVDFAMRLTVWLLYIVEFANWDAQSVIGYGRGDGSAVGNMGYTDSMPYHTGTSQKGRTTYGLGVQYRWIEGLWDNALEWMDGCYYNPNGMSVIIKPSQFSDTANGTVIGIPASGNITAFDVIEKSGVQWIIPSRTFGTDSTYVADSWMFDENCACPCSGGNYTKNRAGGMFYMTYATASDALATVGSRVQELP